MADYAFGSTRALRSKLVPGHGGGTKLGQLVVHPSGGFRERGLSLLPQNRYNWEGRLGYVSHTHVGHALLSPGALMLESRGTLSTKRVTWTCLWGDGGKGCSLRCPPLPLLPQPHCFPMDHPAVAGLKG